jgi:hypothetical protein
LNADAPVPGPPAGTDNEQLVPPSPEPLDEPLLLLPLLDELLLPLDELLLLPPLDPLDELLLLPDVEGGGKQLVQAFAAAHVKMVFAMPAA